MIRPGVDLLQANPKVAKAMVASGRDPRVDRQHRGTGPDTCLRYGVRAIITDRPAYMLDLLDR
ncbi:MAG: hypothetical protein U0R78_19445 [Nocardioidaceae bacterium]